MKKHFKFFLILFVFCLSFTLCNFLPESFTAIAEGEDANIVEISSADDLESFVSSYSATDAAKTLRLTADINMSGRTLTSTIGKVGNPFGGTFDGRGYTISNLSIDASGLGATQYSAFFGYTKNATIKNLSINNVSLKTAGALTNFAGGFVGRAESTKIEMCQLTGNLTFDSTFSAITSFGGFVGTAVDSRIENCISKPNLQTVWSLNDSNGKSFYCGGLVGNQINSKTIFDVVSTNIGVVATSEFNGSLYAGGVCGSVSRVGSEITNIAMSNTISCTNNSTSGNVLCGQISGIISSPTPNPSIQAISNIHYVEKSNISLFGDVGDYVFTVSNTHDNILPSSILSLSREFFTDENNSWHPLYGNFDFDKVWYGQEVAQLQPFYGNYSVRVSSNLHTNIFDSKTTLESAYRYGDKVSMTFAFKEIGEEDSDDSHATQDVPLYSDFYELNSITRNSNEVSKVSQDDEGNYVLSNSDNISISTDLNAKTFTITIDSINMSTDGIYNLVESAKTFNLSITSKGYNKNSDGSESQRVGETPAWVYAYGSQTKRNVLPNETLYFGKSSQNATYITEVKANEPYAFGGWWIDNAEEEDVKLDTTSQTLVINFGQGYFVKDINIYAKWIYNACTVTFLFDDGIEKIELFSGRKTISANGESVDISKGDSSLKMDIYVKKDRTFDADDFIKNLTIYKIDSSSATETFCTLNDTTTSGDLTCFKFQLNMTLLNTDDYANGFTVEAKSTKEVKAQSSWLWIGLGIGGGVIVFGGIVILIIVLKRRSGFGGGMGGGSFKRSSFKGYY